MKPSTRRILGLVSAWVAVVAVVVSAQQPAGSTAPPGDKSPQQIAFERFQRAERVMNMSCSVSGCHTVRPIQTAAKDKDGWTKTVDAMVEKGAKFEFPEDKDILIEYLVQQHGPLPDGEGKAILLNTCTICHDLQRVRTRRATPEGWKELLEEMIFEGAPLSDENIPILLVYLARNFRPGQ
jgi:cytochrome c5